MGYQQLTARAMEWFARARKLNPWEGACDLGYGWCLDWLATVGGVRALFRPGGGT